MPHTGIVRVESTYPAPAASKDLEPGPLVIDAWVCPDRATALALFWLRNARGTMKTMSPEVVRRSLLEAKAKPHPLEPGENPPGERACWNYPRLVIAVILPKGHKPMPADRLGFLRGNVVVEASTVEFRRNETGKDWEAWTIKQCAPDVLAVMRAIDSGLLKLERR